MTLDLEITDIKGLQDKLDRMETLVYSLLKKHDKQWYSIPEACEYLDLKSSTVRRLITRGLLKRSGATRHIRITRDSLEQFNKMVTL